MRQLTVTSEERAKIERGLTELTEKYFPPIPPGCPAEIRRKIVGERCRRLGVEDYAIRALLAPVVDRPAPAHRAVETAKPTVESEDAATAQLLSGL